MCSFCLFEALHYTLGRRSKSPLHMLFRFIDIQNPCRISRSAYHDQTLAAFACVARVEPHPFWIRFLSYYLDCSALASRVEVSAASLHLALLTTCSRTTSSHLEVVKHGGCGAGHENPADNRFISWCA